VGVAPGELDVPLPLEGDDCDDVGVGEPDGIELGCADADIDGDVSRVVIGVV
jgi:hypothetical protein